MAALMRCPTPGAIDDGYLVEPERLDERIPRHDPRRRKPVYRPGCWPWLLALGLWLAFFGAVFYVIAPALDALDATPRNAPSAAQSGAPSFKAATHAGVMEGSSVVGSDAPYPEPSRRLSGGAPSPSADLGTAIYSASATWCAPTATQCQSWGPPARLAAVNSFRFGDAPYWVRVERGSASVLALVVSYCACGGIDGAIDLSPSAFSVLAPLSRGRVQVTVEVLDWAGLVR